ncbi:MAG: hypothetical protein GY743_17945 [Planctomycetaceae bacterium]|nr:hypothetical protein [Planctomycetaceae bacterium]
MSDFWSNELVTDYLDDRLSPEEKMRVDEHLQANPQDRGLLAEYQEMQKALRETPRYGLDDEFSSRVVQSIKMSAGIVEPGETVEVHQAVRSTKKSAPAQWRYTASMIASLAAILLLAFFLLPRAQETHDMAKAENQVPTDRLQTDSARSLGQEVIEADSPPASPDLDLTKDPSGRGRGFVQSGRGERSDGFGGGGGGGGGGLPSEPGAAMKTWDQLEMAGEDDTGTFGGSTQDEVLEEATAEEQSKSMGLAEGLSDDQSEASPSRESQLVLVRSSEANLAVMERWGSQVAKTLKAEAEVAEATPRPSNRRAENKIAGGRGTGRKEIESTMSKESGLGKIAEGDVIQASPAAGESALPALAFEVEATEEQLQKLLQLIQAERVTLNQESQKLWFEQSMQEEANANLGALVGRAEQQATLSLSEKAVAPLNDMAGVTIRRIRLREAKSSWQAEAEESGVGAGTGESVKKQKPEQGFRTQRSAKAQSDKRATGEIASPEIPRQRYLLVVQLTPTDAAKPLPGDKDESSQALPSGK